LLVFGITCAVLIAYSLHRGQDLNWDQLNYHFYSGWALHNRLRTDVFAAGFQTYYNHLFYFPFYFLVTTFRPRTAATLLSAIQALNVLPLYALSRHLIATGPRRLQIFLSVLAAAAGMFSPLFLSEIGTSFIDVFSSTLVLLALLLASQGLCDSIHARKQALLLGASGLIMGALAGVKFVNLPFAIGLATALLFFPARLSDKSKRLAITLTANLAGFLFTAAPLAWTLWTEFSNPLFPHYNRWFKSPFFLQADVRDVRAVGHSAWDIFGYAFQWAKGTPPNNELPFRDIRFALILGGIAVAACVYLGLYFGRGRDRQPARDGQRTDRITSNPGSRLLLVFFASSYLTWLFMFGFQRYIITLELLTGLILLYLVDLLIRNRLAKVLIVVTVAVVCMVMVKVPDWGHIRWGPSWYGISAGPQFREANAVYLSVSEPIGYLYPFCPQSSRFIAIRSPQSLDGADGLRNRITQLVSDHDGPVRLLAHQSSYAADRLTYAHWVAPYGRRLSSAGCTVIPGRAPWLVSCPLERFQLPADLHDAVHIGFGEDMKPSGYESHPIKLGREFTIEAIVRAFSPQTAYATITSNHPGSAGFRGITIEQKGLLTNHYRVGLGSGTQWMSGGEFQLPAGERTHIAVVVTAEDAKLYLNGQLRSAIKLAGPVEESDYPLCIGNWRNKDRVFAGAIEEYRLMRRGARAEEVSGWTKPVMDSCAHDIVGLR